MSQDADLFNELKCKLREVKSLGNDQRVWKRIREIVPAGITSPRFDCLPRQLYYRFTGSPQVGGIELEKHVSYVFQQYSEQIENNNHHWVVVGDQFTQDAYLISHRDICEALQTFLQYPHSVLAMKPTFESGVYFDMMWSATIFATGLRESEKL